MTEYYVPSGKPEFESRALSVEVRNEFVTIQYSFDAVQTDMIARSISSGQVYTGVHDFSGATLYAKTLVYGASGNQVATVDYVNAAQFQAIDLPGQAGKSGYALFTNGTNPYWALVAGAGGANITGNITLTSASAAAMTVTPAAPGLYATLPDSTTCIKTTTIFSLYNDGDYDYGVKNSAGTQLGWIRPRTGAMVGLSDNATAAGSWTPYGLEKIGVTAELLLPSVSGVNYASGALTRVSIDSNRSLFLFGGTSCYAVVYDQSSSTWGSPALVRLTDVGMYTGILSAANQVLVVSAQSTALEAVTLSISGTTITVNTGTKASATLAAAWTTAFYPSIVAVGSSFVLGYVRGSGTIDSALRALTVTGTTPAIGSESSSTVTGSPNGAPMLYASGSIVRWVTAIDAQIRCTPYTVSGTTLTIGTAANVTATGGRISRTFLNGNGRIVCVYVNTSTYATVFTLSGTVESASTVAIQANAWGGLATSGVLALSNTKTLVLNIIAGSMYANILTDTAGTSTAGTEIQVSNYGIPVYIGASVVYNGQAVVTAHATAQGVWRYAFDYSGASPSLLNCATYSASIVPTAAGTDYMTRRSAYSLYTASGVTIITQSDSIAKALMIGNRITPINSVTQLIVGVASASVAGANNNESYFQTGSSVGTSPVTFQKIEAAA